MKHRNGIFCKESAGTVNVIMSIIRGTIVGQKRDDNWVANWFPREKFDPGKILILWNMHFHCWNFEKQRRREGGGAEKEVEGKKRSFLAHLFCSLRGSDKENQAILWALFGLTWQMVVLWLLLLPRSLRRMHSTELPLENPSRLSPPENLQQMTP